MEQRNQTTVLTDFVCVRAVHCAVKIRLLSFHAVVIHSRKHTNARSTNEIFANENVERKNNIKTIKFIQF